MSLIITGDTLSEFRAPSDDEPEKQLSPGQLAGLNPPMPHSLTRLCWNQNGGKPVPFDLAELLRSRSEVAQLRVQPWDMLRVPNPRNFRL